MATVAQGPGLHEVAKDVYAWIGPEGRTNSAFVVWDDAVMVVDSLYGSALAGGLQEQIRSVTASPVRYVIDTHEHWDHCFGNQYFPALYVGHENCRRSLVERPDAQRRFGIQMRPELEEEFAAVQILPPVLTYTEQMTLYRGGRRVNLLYFGRAHTAGDTIVWLPDDGVAVAGDVFVNARSPYVGDGYPRSWVQALQRLEELPAHTFVPGHGDLGRAEDVRAQREWMQGAVARIAAAQQRGLSREQAERELQIAAPQGWTNQQVGQDLIAPAYREAQAAR